MRKAFYFIIVVLVFCLPFSGFADSSYGFLSVKGNRIVNENGREVKLRGFHYDCFHIFGKDVYDAIDSRGGDADGVLLELADYYFRKSDIAKIKDMGANVVRVGFRLWHIEKSPYVYNEEILSYLDYVIHAFGQNGIYVILDLHAAGQNPLIHNREYGNILWSDSEFRKRVIALWGVIAKRYRENPYIAGFDIINEPYAPNKRSLKWFYLRVINKIRRVDKKHIIFLEQNLYDMENIQFGGLDYGPNTAFSIHFYKPHRFTNQGNGGRPLGYEYPGEYNGVYWDKNRIRKYFANILDYIGNKPLFVGEFSAAVWSGGDYAIQWITDVMDVLNNSGVHYTFFQYKFSMRKTRAFYVPREDIFKQLKQLNRTLKYDILNPYDLTSNEKSLVLTENFESFAELTETLENGFWE